jgi:hypothetical protein
MCYLLKTLTEEIKKRKKGKCFIFVKNGLSMAMKEVKCGVLSNIRILAEVSVLQ